MKDILKNVLDSVRKKVDYADARMVTTRSERVRTKNGTVDAITDGTSRGFGIRVIADGCWGFSSSSVLTKDEAARVAAEAIEIAQATNFLKKMDVVLAEEKPAVAKYRTRIVKDPFKVSLDDKIALLLEADRLMRKNPAIKVAEGAMSFWQTDKFFLSTEGADIDQTIVESGAGLTATAVGNGDVQRRSFPASWGDTATRGYEFVEGLEPRRERREVGRRGRGAPDRTGVPLGRDGQGLFSGRPALRHTDAYIWRLHRWQGRDAHHPANTLQHRLEPVTLDFELGQRPEGGS